MYRKSKCLTLTIVLLPAISFAGILDFFKSGTSEALQHDFDIVRLNDLVQLSGYIEQYHDLTGRYPLEGETELPHYVHIATKEQEKYADVGPPYSHKRTSAKAFIDELQKELGTDIQIPFDLQRVPTNKPNFYIYMIKDSTYYLAVHVHQDFPFANKIGDYYNKVEVTNYPGTKRKGTWLRSDLIVNPSFVDAIEAIPYKPGYAEELREKLGANDAF